MMKLIDRVYGEIHIDDPLIEELILSAPMQRLKKISQTGATVYLEPKRDITRFEHSVGVWYLLKRFGASIEEQVAGLLHDTPHTAFSHVIDMVYPNKDHTFHERFTEKVVMESEIPGILKRNGINVSDVLQKEAFHLLDSELPDLSADRIDYFFRDTRPDELFPIELVNQFLDEIKVVDNKFFFKSKSYATLYAILFLNACRLLWLDPNSHGSYFLLSGALKRALDLGELVEDDLFKTDEELMRMLKAMSDSKIQELISRLSPSTSFVFTESGDAEFEGNNKTRVVDPLVLNNGELVRVSELVPRLSEMFDHFKKTYKYKGVKVK